MFETSFSTLVASVRWKRLSAVSPKPIVNSACSISVVYHIIFNVAEDHVRQQSKELLGAILSLVEGLHACPDCDEVPVICNYLLTGEQQEFIGALSILLRYGVTGSEMLLHTPSTFTQSLWHATCMFILARKLGQEYTRHQRSVGAKKSVYYGELILEMDCSTKWLF